MGGEYTTTDFYNKIGDLEEAKETLRQVLIAKGADVSTSVSIDNYPTIIENLDPPCYPDDVSLAWIGNGELEYELGNDASARATRVACVGNNPINYNEAYYDIPINITENTRIETEIYYPTIAREYFAGWMGIFVLGPDAEYVTTDDTSTRIGRKVFVTYTSHFDHSRTYHASYLDCHGDTVAWDASTISRADISRRPYLSLYTPLSFSFADVRFTGGKTPYWTGSRTEIPTTLAFPGVSFGLGFSTGLRTSASSDPDYIDQEPVPSYPARATTTSMSYWGDMASGTLYRFSAHRTPSNTWYPMTITFKQLGSLTKFIDLHIPHEGGWEHWYKDASNNEHTEYGSATHAYKPLGDFTYGTYNLRLFGSISNNSGCYKGWRYKAIKVYKPGAWGVDTLVMNLEPRLHWATQLLVPTPFPCWYDTLSDTYYYPTGDVTSLNYGTT